MNKLDRYTRGLEPVRLRDWSLAVAFPLVGVVAEAITDWDTATGWYGLAAGVVLRLTTRSVRERVTPVKTLDTGAFVND